MTRWALSQTVHKSIEQQASGIEAPELGSEDQLLAGAANFEAMCSECHAPPGRRQSVAARGMYPRPPELTHAAEEKSAGEIFWVIKHGIKASGMPAWGGSHSDEDMWAMTAFVEKLPDMSAAEYDRLLARAEGSGVGHHSGGGGTGHDGGRQTHELDATTGSSKGHDNAHGHGSRDGDHASAEDRVDSAAGQEDGHSH
ncbi:cytochrome c family protein [Salinisphaera dokdonensis CL-ES53]|uniref:Cytochrome c family protein n=1 Tax=Salinisphaera dokdonensis CL-ES53 TaxID=1304272 RepID=A0ABV2B4Z5_9GAMM